MKRTVLIFLVAAASLIGAPTASLGATITPTTTADQYNTDPAQCSLREAVEAARLNAAFGGCPAGSGADTIPLPAGVFTLSIAGADENEFMNVSGDINIFGGEPLAITHSGTGQAVIDAGGINRAFQLADNTPTTISGVTIRNGAAVPGHDGGAIDNTNALLTLTDVTLTNNLAGAGGGGIKNRQFGTLTMTNVTISGNRAGSFGGGFNTEGVATLNNVTVIGNVADSDADGNGDGGGVARRFTGILNLHNTIVTGNADGSPGAETPDCVGSPTSLGNNLIGNTTGCSFTAVGGDLLNVNPLLGPLADNGGGTFTHALSLSSPAVNHGSGCAPTDQRGVPRPQGAGCDIGAYELASCQGKVATLVGTAGPDTLVGTNQTDVIVGFGGKDKISGRSGGDRVCAGGGKDQVSGGGGKDRLNGEKGNDVLRGGKSKDTLKGGQGKDTLIGGGSRDKLKGGPGKDKLKQ